MSIDLVAAVLWLDLEPATKLVAVALCDRADGSTGKCFPSLREITFRASLSEKSAIKHLRVLEDLGYVRRGRRPNARMGQTTERWLNVQRILSEGRDRKAECEALRWASASPEESTGDSATDGNQLKLEDGSPELQGIDHLNLTPLSPEPASRPTVITPRPLTPSDPPSDARAHAPAGDVGNFASALQGRLHPSLLARLGDCLLGDNEQRVVIQVEDEALQAELLQGPIAFRLRMCALEAGFQGFEVHRVEGVPQ